MDDSSQWLVIAGNKLLIWDYAGRFRLRAPDGHWGREFRTSLGDISTAAADGDGFLVSGSLPFPNDSHIIVRFDAEGRELRRWYTPQSIFHITVTRKGRWAATWDRLLRLQDDGTIGAPEPFPESISRGRLGGALLIDGERNQILCRGADLTLAHRDYARCQELGPNGWSIAIDADGVPPMPCGSWIIFRMRPTLERLQVHSLRTGVLVAERNLVKNRTTGTLTPLTCADSQTLAIGGRSLEFARLPDLQTRWKKPLRRGRIADLAILRDEILFRLEDSPRIYSLPRPGE